jgi:hypothetical protein
MPDVSVLCGSSAETSQRWADSAAQIPEFLAALDVNGADVGGAVSASGAQGATATTAGQGWAPGTSGGNAFVPNEYQKMWCKGVCRRSDYEKGERWAQNLHGIEVGAWMLLTNWATALTGAGLTGWMLQGSELAAPSLVPLAEVKLGLLDKAAIGAATSAVSNVGGQYAAKGTVDGRQTMVAMGTGAVGGAMSHLLFTEMQLALDFKLPWYQNALNGAAVQSAYFFYNKAQTAVISRLLGIDPDDENRAATWNSTGGAVRALFWQTLGAWRGWGDGHPLKFGEPGQQALDAASLGVVQKAVINGLNPHGLTR